MYNVVCGIDGRTSAGILDNRVLRKVFVPKRDGETGQCEDYITRSLVICDPRQILGS